MMVCVMAKGLACVWLGGGGGGAFVGRLERIEKDFPLYVKLVGDFLRGFCAIFQTLSLIVVVV